MLLQSVTQLPGDVARVSEVVRVLVKYGLAQWLEGTEWETVRRMLTSHSGDLLTDQSFPVRIRMALTDLGTTFIKLGQVLSTRPDLVGLEIAHELSHLQTGTPADAPDVVVAMIEKELSRPITDCFAEFDSTAMASASIGQVHRAKLPNGRPVVVKLQHPGIEGTIQRDLNILTNLAVHAERQEELKRYQPVAVVREFRGTLMRELDFRREMRNLQQFRRNFAEDTSVAFPKPYPELSTGRVLTKQLLTGISVGDEEKLKQRHLDREAIARKGAGVFVQMIFRDGFYHADPHPGNIVAMAKGRVGILDGGMVGRIDDELRERIVEILLAAADKDAPRLAEVIAAITKAPHNLDRGGFAADLMEVFSQYGTQSVDQFEVGGALTEVTRIMHEYNLFMPSRLSLLIKCLIVLEEPRKASAPISAWPSCWSRFGASLCFSSYRPRPGCAKPSASSAIGSRWPSRSRAAWAICSTNCNPAISRYTSSTRRWRDPSTEWSTAYAPARSSLPRRSCGSTRFRRPFMEYRSRSAAGYMVAAFLTTRVLWLIRWEKHPDD